MTNKVSNHDKQSFKSKQTKFQIMTNKVSNHDKQNFNQKQESFKS